MAIKDAAGFANQDIGILITGPRIAHETEHILACGLDVAGDGGGITCADMGGPLAGQRGSGSGVHERTGQQGDGGQGLAHRLNQAVFQLQVLSLQKLGMYMYRYRCSHGDAVVC